MTSTRDCFVNPLLILLLSTVNWSFEWSLMWTGFCWMRQSCGFQTRTSWRSVWTKVGWGVVFQLCCTLHGNIIFCFPSLSYLPCSSAMIVLIQHNCVCVCVCVRACVRVCACVGVYLHRCFTVWCFLFLPQITCVWPTWPCWRLAWDSGKPGKG